jgi:hypothetical protein
MDQRPASGHSGGGSYLISRCSQRVASSRYHTHTTSKVVKQTLNLEKTRTMPAALSSERPPQRHDDLDDFNVGDLSDDPFASPPPQSKSTQKRKEPDSGLGIEEEVEVKKRVRVPRVKLDENL